MKIIHFRLFMRKKGSMSMHASNRLLNFLIINVNADVSFCIMVVLAISLWILQHKLRSENKITKV